MTRLGWTEVERAIWKFITKCGAMMTKILTRVWQHHEMGRANRGPNWNYVACGEVCRIECALAIPSSNPVKLQVEKLCNARDLLTEMANPQGEMMGGPVAGPIANEVSRGAVEVNP